MNLNFNRPQLWWQPMCDERCSGRLRIFYPCGASEWSANYVVGYETYSEWGDVFENPEVACCFALKSKSLKQTYKAMRRYDKKYGYPPAEFLGYL